MAILSKGTTYSDGDQVTSSNLNALVDSATFASGAVDDSSTQLSSGKIIVKDLGIATGKIAANAVTTAKIADSNVTKAKIENLANYKVLGNVSGGAAAPAEVALLDEDNMSSNSATSLATQQSIKAYVDTQLTAEDLDFAGDSGNGSVDLDGETFTIAGAAGLDTSASSQTLTIALDFNEISDAAIADGDFIPFVDATDSTTKKEAIADIATLFAGTGLSASSSVLSVDASQTQITSVGTLGAGAISSGFGNIDIGSSNLTSTGSVSLGATSFNDNNITNVGSIALDTITNDGTDVTIDSSGDIILDAGDADIRLKDDGTQFGRFANSSSNLIIASSISDKDILFNGSDGGVQITALTLDMSAAGAATFNDKITAVGTSVFTNLDISGDIDVDGTTNLDAVDIDGNVQIDGTVTVGVDDTGHDVKFFGATSGSYMEWDESLNRLIVNADGIGIKLDGSSSTTKSIFFRNTNAANPAQVYADGSLRLFTEDSGTDIRFHVNSDGSSNEKLRINATGVGIGTNDPGAELDIHGATAEVFINSTDSSFSRVKHEHNGTAIWTSGTRSSDDYHIFRESGSGDVIIDNGNLGIGTASPAKKLHVKSSNSDTAESVAQFGNGDIDGGLEIKTNGNGGASLDWGFNAVNSRNLVFDTNQTERMRITSTGEFQINGGGSGSIVVNDEDSSLCPTMTFLRNGAGTSTNDFIKFENSGGEVASINSSGGAIFSTVSKGSGSFKIAHPLESKKDTHNLVHSFLESPQADLIYRGRVDLVDGLASVNIDLASDMTDGTFVVLCRDVQSFTTNESGWTAVRSSVDGNILTIEAQDNTCTDSISWMVVGERQDQHMYDTDWTDENGKVVVEPLIPEPTPEPEVPEDLDSEAQAPEEEQEPEAQEPEPEPETEEEGVTEEE